MTYIGFWRQAAADRERLALVAPDRTEHRAGELLDRANQISHRLRALRLEAREKIAVYLPNCAELLQLYFGALQIGLYFTPINWHLVGPEVAYIVDDSDAKVFVAHERLAEHAAGAADEIDFPAEKRFAVGAIDGFRPLAELTA